MTKLAHKIADALYREYSHEQSFEVKFPEDELLKAIADILRQEYGCEVYLNPFKHGLTVRVPKAKLQCG